MHVYVCVYLQLHTCPYSDLDEIKFEFNKNVFSLKESATNEVLGEKAIESVIQAKDGKEKQLVSSHLVTESCYIPIK